MALNLNTSPYYDDFNDDNRFHRVLFKPGVPVQARELTQLQTILQDQMEKGFGFVVQEGAVITGCAETLRDVDYIKVNDTDAAAVTINNTDLVKYKDKEIVGSVTGLRAVIQDTETGTVAGNPNLKTLYIKYLNTISGHTHFASGETLTVYTANEGTTASIAAGTDLNGYTFVVNNLTDNTRAGTYYGNTSDITLQPGIIHARGSFIKTDKITVRLDKYNNLKRKHIGFVVTESLQQSATDTTLLDPAQGSYNYNAPGADRLKYTVTLASYDDTATKPENFYTYAHASIDGIERIGLKDNPLAGLGEILANRTYDESGNYLVRGNNVSLREHLNDGTNGGVYASGDAGSRAALVVQVDPGVSYVGGFKRELQSSKRIPIMKASQFITKEAQPISTSYGNYIEINYVEGLFDVDGGAKIELYNAVQDGNASAQGSKVGEAKVRQLVYSSGTPGNTAAVYRLYVYDLQMLSGDFTAVKGVRYNSGDTWGGVANTVLVSSKSEIKESKVNKLVYRLSENNIKTLKAESGGTYDYTYQYQKEFDISLNTTDGTGSLTLSGNETFPYSGTLTDTQKRDFILIAKAGFTQNSATVAVGEHIDLTSNNSNASVTVNSATSITIDTGGAITGTSTVRVYVPVQVSDATPIAKTLSSDKYVKIDTNSHSASTSGEYSIGVADLYKVESIRAHTSALTSDTDGIDVTNDFRVSDGQEDNFYGLAKIIKKNSSTLNLTTYDHLLIKYSYFDSTVSSASFACFDSYPVDDTTASLPSGKVRTEDIPNFQSQKYGEFNLRDCVDFRPYMTNTATITGTIASATTNPANDKIINRPGSGLTNPLPTKTFSTDLAYYIGKKLRIVLDFDGNYRVVEGSYSQNPKMPAEPSQSMTMAEIDLVPFPCLSPEYGKVKQKGQYTTSIKNVSQKRYTMKNISGLEQRIKNLEYYASLNLLENYAKDQTIVNSSGTDRFKNGILVDPFTGHNVGSVLDPDYKISIDPEKKHARPFFVLENIDTKVASNIDRDATFAGTQLKLTGNTVTLPFNRMVLTDQMQASQTENLTKELLFKYNGEMELTPDVDNFIDTAVQPAVNVNFDGNYDAWENMANAWGTQWGSWEDSGAANVTSSTSALDTYSTSTERFGGSSATFTTTTTEQQQTRSGIALNVSAITEVNSLGEKIVDMAIAPFMRSRQVTVTCTRLKPETRVYPFFDGEAVSDFCTLPDGTTTTLSTDGDGKVTFLFTIPAGRFKAGSRVLKVTNNSDNGTNNVTTQANAIYESSGFIQQKQDTIVGFKSANVNSTQFSDSRVVTETSFDVSIGAGTPLPPPPPPTIINNPVPVPVPVTPAPTPPPDVGLPPATTSPSAITSTPEVTPVTTTAGPTTTANTPISTPVETTPSPIIDPVTTTPAPPTTTPFVIDFDVDEFLADFRWDFNFGWGMDPLAQTFTVPNVPGGAFITDIEIFFKNRPATGNNGVTMQIREVINGVPGPRILPNGSKRVERADIITSSESGGTTTINPTSFTFNNPVYLQGDKEYCFVPKPENDDTGYDIYISQLGENQVGTTERITKQPHGGMMFSSANDRTWNAHQNQDIMFKMHRASFKQGTVSGKVSNDNLDWINFSSYSTTSAIAWTAGTSLVGHTPTITNAGTGYTGLTPTVTVTNTGTNGTGLTMTATVTGDVITALTVTNPGSGYTSAPTIAISAGTGTQATGTLTLQQGKVVNYNGLDEQVTVDRGTDTTAFTASQLIGNTQGYGTISSFTDKVINEVALNAALMTPHQTTTATARVSINETGAGSAVGDPGVTEVYSELDFNTTTQLDKEHTIYSRSNEISTYSANKTALLEVSMSTNFENISPAITLDQLDLLCIANSVNNDSTNEDTRYKGNSSSRYITRRVNLEDGQDAEDIMVYLDAAIPTEGNVKVYGKLMNSSDQGNFQEDLSWVELSSRTDPFESTTDFAEYKYNLPSKGSNAAGLNGSGIYEYDVKSLLSIAVTAGGSSYSSSPTITITGGGGYGAAATATVSGGVIQSIEITNPGREYTSTPTVTITDSGGSSATATATVGTVTHTGFKTFAVKVVPLSTTTSKVPFFKDLRAIALQV